MTASDSRLSHLRLLIVSPSQALATSQATSPKPSSFPPLLETLTSAKPAADLLSFAGYTSHQPLHLKTKYYENDINIWCDELPRTVLDFDTAPDHSNSVDTDSEELPDLAQWQEQMTSPPAREVRDAIGGIILILPIGGQRISAKPDEQLTVYVQAVHHLREMMEDESGGRDVASVIVVQPANPAAVASKHADFLKQLEDFTTRLEEWCHDEGIFGWDFVHWDAQLGTSDSTTPGDKNSFGEKLGIARVKEVLEAVDWSATPVTESDDPDLDKDGLDIFNSEKFKTLDTELQQEMMGLKLSMMDRKDGTGHSEGEDMSSNQMQELMHRVVAIRDAGVELPKEERQAFAKREVEKLIRELS